MGQVASLALGGPSSDQQDESAVLTASQTVQAQNEASRLAIQQDSAPSRSLLSSLATNQDDSPRRQQTNKRRSDEHDTMQIDDNMSNISPEMDVVDAETRIRSTNKDNALSLSSTPPNTLPRSQGIDSTSSSTSCMHNSSSRDGTGSSAASTFEAADAVATSTCAIDVATAGDADPSEWPFETNTADTRSRRQVLVDSFRNTRRRSSQRLSQAFSRHFGSGGTSSRSSLAENEGTDTNMGTGDSDSTAIENVEAEGVANILNGEALGQSEQGMRDPFGALTPPPEEDPMFEERQRARRLVEEALAQLQAELSRSRPGRHTDQMHADSTINLQQAGYSSSNPNSTIEMPPAIESEDVEMRTSTDSSTMQLGEASALHSSASTPNHFTQSVASSLPRIFAPLPRRSSSRSPTPPHSTPGQAVPVPSTTSASGTLSQASQAFHAAPVPVTPRTVSDVPHIGSGHASPTTNPASQDDPPNFMVPRRILVQGIVSSSPPSNPILPSRPASGTQVPPWRAPRTQATDSAAADSGFWDELPGSEAVDAVSGRHDSTEADRTWEDAVAEILARRPEGPHARPDTAATDAARGLQDQANLIGRLLCVAAAATAATLLPGEITVNGNSVSGFGDSQAASLFGGTGIPASGMPSAAPSSQLPRRRSDSLGTFRSAPRAATTSTSSDIDTTQSGLTSGSSSLQDILRNALAAAFRSANSASPTAETEGSLSTSPDDVREVDETTDSASISSDSTAQSTASIHNPQRTSRLGTSTREQASADAFSAGAALAIPVTALHSDTPYVTGSGHPAGSFERFLADLQSDVSAAILRSRQNTATAPGRTPAEATTTGHDSSHAAGLEEMRPLLDNIDEVASEGSAPTATAELAPSSSSLIGSGQSPVNIGNATSDQEQTPFSFFRSFRFPAQAMVRSASLPATLQPESTVARSQDMQSDISTRHEDTAMQEARPAPAEISADTHNGEPLPSVIPTSTNFGDTVLPVAAAVGQPAAALPPRPLANRHVVPMLLVGVRSTSSQGLGSMTDGEQDNSGSSASVENVHSNTTPNTESPQAGRSNGPSRPAARAGGRTSQNPSGFVLWILGGIYPANHPIVIAPSLLGDDAMSYEELIRLAEMLGSVKPPTVTQEEIQKSDLKIVKSEMLPKLLCEGGIRDITSDRCLICLEDYEADEDVRILRCQHCFHQPCVDRWLSSGANTCPACRNVGVAKSADERGEPVPETAVAA